ncbi:McrB family protein [Succinivibrio dextrinosolvens]|uniref:McrB family protein n=1 Tax=Succinivibrio dextrinosolvens TaxID=83771 RepID=UPI00241F1EDD|nr:AAA family ATPase [Succinivibrio dextrinosolvens]MBE6422830.1 hypothetical protein [Succinivibrio dextrinosolvens]
MGYQDLLDLIINNYQELSKYNYDAIMVKPLPVTGLYQPRYSTSHESHIAVTGKSMDIFPNLSPYGYFDSTPQDKNLKTFFLLNFPVNIYKSNIKDLISYHKTRNIEQATKDQLDSYNLIADKKKRSDFLKNFLKNLSPKQRREINKLDDEQINEITNTLLNDQSSNESVNATVCAWRGIRGDGSIQLGISNVSKDSPSFLSFRKLFLEGDILVILKRASEFLYDIIGISKDSNIGQSLSTMNGDFLINPDKKYPYDSTVISTNVFIPQNPSNNKKAKNILLYGVPGAGKSRYIKDNYCSDETAIERVVFHPDYTYSDFVGQILPIVNNGQLSYEFTAGPFTSILDKAIKNPDKTYYLIIEELNRGNAPAIFGEIFQLLDRKKSNDPNEGESEYSITNFDIAKYIFSDKEAKIKLPSNLWILATMNTSDQNVFTLDTAFQRRWQMKHIKNDVSSADHAKVNIEGSVISWESFALSVNRIILQANEGASSSEDKRLGAYFATEVELTRELFPEKVLKYLWDDALKLDRERLFKSSITSFDEILSAYDTSGDPIEAVIRDDVFDSMKNYSNSVVSN